MHTSLKHLFAGLFFILVITGCSKENSFSGNEFNPTVSKTILDEKYGT